MRLEFEGQDFRKSSGDSGLKLQEMKAHVRRDHKCDLPVRTLAKIRLNSCLVPCGNVAFAFTTLL